MKTSFNIDGQKIRRAVVASRFSKEQVVAAVQDAGYKFSLAGLDKVYRNEFPVKNTEEIVAAIAFKCGRLVSDFAEDEAKTA